jgi:hypothetical protein
MNRERVETTEDFKARIAAIIGDKSEHIAGARDQNAETATTMKPKAK